MSLGTEDRRRNTILAHINPESTHSNALSTLSTNFTSAQAAPQSNAAVQGKTVNHDDIVSYQLTPQGVALLAIKNPPVNALSDNVLHALQHQLEKGLADPKCKAFVVTSQIKGFFIAGADIAQIQKRQKSGEDFDAFIKQNSDFLNGFEKAFKPSVAAISGQCLGGGLEVAMALGARVCTPNSSLGLPELNLGLIPGFGGTQRLPRLVGVQKGLEMMLTSAPVKGAQAAKIGLVDDVVEDAKLIPRAIEIALELAEYKRPRKNALNSNRKIEAPGMLANIFKFAEAEAKKKPDLVQIQACINAVKAGLEYNGEYGLETERKEFLRCAGSNTAKSLIHFFFASKATAKVPGISGSSTRQFKKIGVIGGGLMGSGIAASALMAGMSVHIKEVNEQFLNAGLDRVRGIFKSRLEKGRMTQQQYEDVCKRLSGSLDYSAFGQLDMVIEAALENLELKQKIFADLEKNCSPTCILASNTSTIDLLAIGAQTKAQNRIIGLHYFSPAHVMKLLEIVRTEKTDPQIIVDSLQFSKLIQKTPVVVGNCPGFAVNRIFFDYNEGAAFLIDRGVSPYKIDEVMKKFGMPMGVFRMGDMAGLDVAYHAGQTMYNAFKHRSYPPRLTEILVKNKRLGEKTGSGVYKYTKGKAEQDPEIQKYIAQARAEAGNPAPLTVTDEEIVEYIMFPTVNEACRVIEEGMVYRVADIDIAGIFGMGFPAYRGGLMKYAETVGAKKVFERLNEFYQKTGEKLFEPCNYLRQCAEQNKTLYQL